jgi:hypothetical protein
VRRIWSTPPPRPRGNKLNESLKLTHIRGLAIKLFIIMIEDRATPVMCRAKAAVRSEPATQNTLENRSLVDIGGAIM